MKILSKFPGPRPVSTSYERQEWVFKTFDFIENMDIEKICNIPLRLNKSLKIN